MEEEEYHDANFQGSGEPDDLLFQALDSYAAGQRTSTMQPLPCDCTEVPSANMDTRCLGRGIPPYPNLLYYPVPLETSTRRTPDRDIVVNEPNRQDKEDHIDEESDHSTAFIPPPRNRYSPKSPPARRRLRAAHRMVAATPLSSQVANRVVKFARCIKNIHEGEMSCLNCGLLPICPITGQCGHTRCYQCAKETICPCGNYFSGELFVNILIKDLVSKSTTNGQSSPSSSILPFPTTEDICAKLKDNTFRFQPLAGASRCQTLVTRRVAAGAPISGGQRIPITPLARYNHALELLRLGHHRQAVPYLALAAASGEPHLGTARTLLAQAITVLSNNRDPRKLTIHLNRSVRRLSSMSWIQPKDLECTLCLDTFTNPVTTPCGHVYCRTCLERTMDYGKKCPLCLRDIIGFPLSQTRNTLFVEAALYTVNAAVVPLPMEPDQIPIFVCTVAYPSVSCPLFIFDPRYWLMIRRVLESGSRRFGMVACERGQDYVNYGTILEVRDCVHLEDGRSILSTIGISRFKVLERGVRDGCDVARIMPITDTKPKDQHEIQMLAQNIIFKALLWLDRLNSRVLADIQAAFGVLETSGFYDEAWWEGPDGPSWLWWIIAVLPLRTEIKVLILSTDCLAKRMMAVARTLDAVDLHQPSTSGL